MSNIPPLATISSSCTARQTSAKRPGEQALVAYFARLLLRSSKSPKSGRKAALSAPPPPERLLGGGSLTVSIAVLVAVPPAPEHVI